jgi:hypothetical protein
MSVQYDMDPEITRLFLENGYGTLADVPRIRRWNGICGITSDEFVTRMEPRCTESSWVTVHRDLEYLEDTEIQE